MPNFSESLPELFSRIDKEKSKNKKIDMLRKADSQALQTVLQGAYHPKIVWALPSGAPPYKKEDSPYGLCPSVLEREIRKLPYLVQGATMIKEKIRRERLFIDMLEALHPTESELLIQMKDKDIKCNGLTQLLVHEAFPALVPKPEKKDSKKS